MKHNNLNANWPDFTSQIVCENHIIKTLRYVFFIIRILHCNNFAQIMKIKTQIENQIM